MKLTRWLGPLKPCAGGWWESRLRGCGAGQVGFPMQPINAWSNLAYFVAGAILFAWRPTPEHGVLWAALAALTVGSGLYHAWPSVRTARLDHAGMYATFGALTTYAVASPEMPWVWIFMAVAAGFAAYLFQWTFSMNLNAMMGVFLWVCSIAIGPEALTLLVASWSCFAAAMVAWQLDKRRILTRRWGHGIWHVLTAGAVALMAAAAG